MIQPRECSCVCQCNNRIFSTSYNKGGSILLF